VIGADRSGNECTNSAKHHPFSAIVIQKRQWADAGGMAAVIQGQRKPRKDNTRHGLQAPAIL
jgi:hypothetical protein